MDLYILHFCNAFIYRPFVQKCVGFSELVEKHLFDLKFNKCKIFLSCVSNVGKSASICVLSVCLCCVSLYLPPSLSHNWISLNQYAPVRIFLYIWNPVTQPKYLNSVTLSIGEPLSVRLTFVKVLCSWMTVMDFVYLMFNSVPHCYSIYSPSWPTLRSYWRSSKLSAISLLPLAWRNTFLPLFSADFCWVSDLIISLKMAVWRQYKSCHKENGLLIYCEDT